MTRFSPGDTVKIKMPETDDPRKMLEFRQALEYDSIGDGTFVVLETRNAVGNEKILLEHDQMVRVRSSNGHEIMWSGWWFEKC